jgi:SAM-dependent methyltransferase
VLSVVALSLGFGAAALAQTSRIQQLPDLFVVPTPEGWQFETKNVIALEEHQFFDYFVASANRCDEPSEEAGENAPQFVRRFISLNPSIYVIDDVVRGMDEGLSLVLHSDSKAQVNGNRIRIVLGDRPIVCEPLVPKSASYRPVASESEGQAGRTDYQLAVANENPKHIVRSIHVASIAGAGKEISLPQTKVVQKEAQVRLTLTTGDRVYRLTLPPADTASGEIAVSGRDGERLLARRLFPSGILPSGPDGKRLLNRWDSRYRADAAPPWDIGRPSSELKEAVEEGVIRPCRAVVLGCGTGTNAIYLASKGFDVTGIDIAPTALNMSRKKAEEAGVKVHWILADVLAPPELEPFDFIYDRGCYHGVRRQNATGYVQSVRKLSHAGTRILILAGNANEERRYGPPRVKEEELRGDFSEGFDFEWLKETRFDTEDPGGQGALGWSVLLKRKE